MGEQTSCFFVYLFRFYVAGLAMVGASREFIQHLSGANSFHTDNHPQHTLCWLRYLLYNSDKPLRLSCSTFEAFFPEKNAVKKGSNIKSLKRKRRIVIRPGKIQLHITKIPQLLAHAVTKSYSITFTKNYLNTVPRVQNREGVLPGLLL